MDRLTTIAAIATPPGKGAIGIIRVSGPQTRKIIDKVFSNSSKLEPHKLQLGWIQSKTKKIDQSLVAWLPHPNSYTGEDMVEIHCHGGSAILEAVLALLFSEGAKPAEAGEFSKRAFLNNKLDLNQAEAVMTMVSSSNSQLTEIANYQLNGVFSRTINKLSDNLVKLAAQLTADLDFSEEDTPIVDQEKIRSNLQQTQQKITTLLAGSSNLGKLNQGIHIAVIGLPNAGKSTLVNQLLGYDRSIVSAEKGTTRDTVSEQLEINGLAVKLTDTAGLNPAAKGVEDQGIKRTLKELRVADIHLLVIEPGSEQATLDYLQKNNIKSHLSSSKTIVVYSKSDLGNHEVPKQLKGFSAVTLSCKTGKGITDLEKAIVNQAGLTGDNNLMQVISARQVDMLKLAESQLQNILRTKQLPSSDILLLEIEQVISTLNQLTGKQTSQEVIDSVFSQFCIGK